MLVGLVSLCVAVAAFPAGGSSPPILFNDRHVFPSPERLVPNRVLAAIVRNGAILVPLRSIFERMGATVNYDARTRTVDVHKPGADVELTVGKRTVAIDGLRRPLDVPAEIYRGALIVPLRVIAEAMGAYVQWLPGKRVVVLRYIGTPVARAEPAAVTPAPTAPASSTPAPTAPPATPQPEATAAPTRAASPHARSDEAFLAADYDAAPVVYNELSPGNHGSGAFDVKGALEFPLGAETLMVAGHYQTVSYQHNADLPAANCVAGNPGCNTVAGNDATYQPGYCPAKDPGCVTVVGYRQTIAFNGLGQAYVPAFRATETSFAGGLGFKIADPRIYVGIAAYVKHQNYLGYPNLIGIGFGAEKLPDLNRRFSAYGHLYYYPAVGGNYTYPVSSFLGPLSGSVIPLSYSQLDFSAGGTLSLGKRLYLDFGYDGVRANAKTNAPSGTTYGSPFVGLGLHL